MWFLLTVHSDRICGKLGSSFAVFVDALLRRNYFRESEKLIYRVQSFIDFFFFIFKAILVTNGIGFYTDRGGLPACTTFILSERKPETLANSSSFSVCPNCKSQCPLLALNTIVTSSITVG